MRRRIAPSNDEIAATAIALEMEKIMKRILLATAALGIVAALAGTVVAQQVGPGPGDGWGRGFHAAGFDGDDRGPSRHGMMGGRHGMMGGGMMGGGMGDPGMMCENRDARLAGMLAFAETKLDITEQQRPAWTKFADTVKGSTKAMDTVCAQVASGEPPPATLPERVKRMEQMTEARLSQLQAVSPALDELYQTLTPEQKKTANDFMNRRGHR
jgi:protein CpxP